MAVTKQYFDTLLSEIVQQRASDLHITVGRHPTLRIDRTLVPLLKHPIVTADAAQSFIALLLPEHQQEHFLQAKELDFSYSFYDRARFRVNTYFQRGFSAAALRLVPTKIGTFEDLNLPPILQHFATQKQGFFLAVGPTGHGKSTALAAMVNYINQTRAEHIVTVEDPIEYLFTSDRSIIEQREIGIDTADFNVALRSMFRQDVNVAMIGEMRDPETMQTAVTAAETGHLILSTLHTNGAAQTIDRIIDAFPANQQNQIRSQLALTLVGIVSLRLLPRASGGLIPAVEVLVATTAVRNLIRENKTHELDMVIDTGYEEGMLSLNRSLANLIRSGDVTMENALLYALNPRELQTVLKH